MQLIDASLFLSPVEKFQASVLVSDESELAEHIISVRSLTDIRRG